VVTGAGAGACVVVEEPALLTLEGVEIGAGADVVVGGAWEGAGVITLSLVVMAVEGGRAVVVGAVTVTSTSVVTVVPEKSLVSFCVVP